MRKSIKIILVITLITAITAFVLFYLFYFRVHMLLQSFDPASDYPKDLPYRYSITSASCSVDSWKAPTATLYLNVSNSGEENYRNYCNMSLVLVDVKTGEPVMFGIDSDIRDWEAKSITTIPIQIDTKYLDFTSYNMYLSILDSSTGDSLPLNNSLRQNKNGYYLGVISISRLIG
ncbi:MAG: DUF4832 domain-containing protein [Pseudobutyrivibrio sp.]|nr:DUF4832 domain-containing protein [Pseudobutyrivibrio sp.]